MGANEEKDALTLHEVWPADLTVDPSEAIPQANETSSSSADNSQASCTVEDNSDLLAVRHGGNRLEHVRARHEACVEELHGISDLMSGLEAENAQLRNKEQMLLASNEQLSQQVHQLQKKAE